MLANLTWLGFLVCKGLRMASYVPQLWRLVMDEAGAPTTTCTTWTLWTCTNLSTTFYAAVSLNDVWLSTASAAYTLCGLFVICVKAFKRLHRAT